jgi:toxin-antitoxin system PIN domain toxin
VNVWIALTYGGHIHHKIARAWFEEVDMEERVCFCRFTQLSLLRLLTTQAVMGTDEVMTQSQAWQAFDLWLTDRRVLFVEEPPNLDGPFRSLSRQSSASPKIWADSYLAAFAAVLNFRFVTFDPAFQGKIKQLLILRP